MRRPLGAFETAAAITAEEGAFSVVIALRLANGPAPAALERALAALQRRHPLLGVRIVGTGRRRFFETAGVPPIPLRQVERTGDEAWRGAVEDELNGGPDSAAGPLARCVHLPATVAGGPCEIVLATHHAAIDGVSGVPLLDELLALCAGAEPGGVAASAGPDAGPGVDGAGGALPPSSDELFPPRFRGLRRLPGQLRFLLRQGTDEALFRLRVRGARQPPLHAAARCRTLSFALSEAATAGLVGRARRQRVTLNGALGAALLLAAHERLYAGAELPLRCFTFADLRPSLRPLPPRGRLGAYVVPLRYTLRMGPGRGLWALARELAVRVRAGARRGDRYHAVRLMPAMMGWLVRRRSARMAATALSYAGAVSLERRYGAIEVRGLHAFVSNIPLGPEITALVKRFRGRLVWDLVYLDADLDADAARALAEAIVEILERACAEA